MKLNPYVYGLLVLVLFLGTIGVAHVGGFWSVSGKVSASGQKVEPTGVDAQEIKGWMTLDSVATAYKVPLTEIIREFNLPEQTAGNTPLKDLESEEFSVTILRTWLSEGASSP